MTKKEQYKFYIPYLWKGNLTENKLELKKVILVSRIAQKICRKCYARLPLNATVCRNCKNGDLRKRKDIKYKKALYLDKNSKNRTIDKRNIKNWNFLFL